MAAFRTRQGLIQIEQRLYHGEIGEPKADRRRRTLTLGHLAERFRAKAKADRAKPDGWVFQRTEGLNFPIWDSTVRELLHKAAREEGCDFVGFGPYTLRRANITWRQLVGGSATGTSMIAGHSTIEMTEQYTFIDAGRQDQLTQAIQDRLAAACMDSQPAKDIPLNETTNPSND